MQVVDRRSEDSMTGGAQSKAESPERDVQSAHGISPILAYGSPADATLSIESEQIDDLVVGL